MPEVAQEGLGAGDRAAGAEEGFHEDGGEGVGGQGGEQGAGGGDGVAGADEEIVGEVHVGVGGVGGEHEGAAVVGAFEDEDFGFSREGEGGGEGARVCFGAGVREADELHRGREALADDFGELSLMQIAAAEVNATIQRVRDRFFDFVIVVAVDACGVLAQEICVSVVI